MNSLRFEQFSMIEAKNGGKENKENKFQRNIRSSTLSSCDQVYVDGGFFYMNLIRITLFLIKYVYMNNCCWTPWFCFARNNQKKSEQRQQSFDVIKEIMEEAAAMAAVEKIPKCWH